LTWKTVGIVGAVLFLAGFLLGFIPEYQKASKLAMQLETARLESKLREIRELASLSYMDASRMNYGSATEDSERMFGLAREVANETKDDGLRSSLNGLSMAVGFLLLVSLVLSAALAALGKFFGGLMPLPEFVLSGINFIVSLAGVAVLFALIFKYVPEAEITWKNVWSGAVATAFFFTVGKYLIGLYLGKAAVGSAYGAAGSLVVVVVWIYYSAMIFLFGAEFTHVLDSGDSQQNA
jgi:hypothetical protein